MYEKNVTVGKKVSVSFQPEAIFIQKANEYRSEIWVEKGNRKANAKSLLGVLSLGLTSGSKVKISAEGEDEIVAVEALEQFLVR